MKDIIIIGSGGIGREVAWIIEEINEVEKQWNILGFVDDNTEMWGKELNGYKVLGGIEYLLKMELKFHIVVAMANPQVKRDIVKKLNGKFHFATIIYPSVRVNKFIKIGVGTIIYPGVILTVNTEIGKHVLISGNCGIGHDTEIADYSTVLWGSNFSGYDVIGKNVFIGVGVNVAPGVSITKNSKVISGAVLKESV